MLLKLSAVTGITWSSRSHALKCSLLYDPVYIKFGKTAQTYRGDGSQNGGFWVGAVWWEWEQGR